MKTKSGFKKAFSLIEMSVVVLVISILVIGTIQSSKMVKKSRLTAAQTLTKTSPVNDIDDLVLWYETSLDSSFITSEAKDTTTISAWYDNNPNAAVKNNAAQSTSTNQPKFYVDVFNGSIPAIRFDGVDNYMTFDGSSLINSSYSIFVVEQRQSSGGGNVNYFIGGTADPGSGSNINLVLGYNSNTLILQAHYGNDLGYAVAGFTTAIPRIHSFLFRNGTGKDYWLNGGITADATAAQTSPITVYAGSALGRFGTHYFNGDIAEVIIFSRALRTDERQLVETYLSTKYNIRIS